jgi:hypothetical protein
VSCSTDPDRVDTAPGVTRYPGCMMVGGEDGQA